VQRHDAPQRIGARPKDSGAPAEFEASSGTYSMHPSRPNTVVFDFEPRGRRKFDERYVEIETLTAKELEFGTMAPRGG
jgi:hypothetical protein